MRAPLRNTPSDLANPALPVLVRHLDAGRREPADVADLGAVNCAALKPAAAAEHGMLLAERDQARGEAAAARWSACSQSYQEISLSWQ